MKDVYLYSNMCKVSVKSGQVKYVVVRAFGGDKVGLWNLVFA